jgi:hypothetical protein
MKDLYDFIILRNDMPFELTMTGEELEDALTRAQEVGPCFSELVLGTIAKVYYDAPEWLNEFFEIVEKHGSEAVEKACRKAICRHQSAIISVVAHGIVAEAVRALESEPKP